MVKKDKATYYNYSLDLFWLQLCSYKFKTFLNAISNILAVY